MRAILEWLLILVLLVVFLILAVTAVYLTYYLVFSYLTSHLLGLIAAGILVFAGAMMIFRDLRAT